ncbi:MAG: LamG domain-containing protein [Saccharofermentanales bacterium]
MKNKTKNHIRLILSILLISIISLGYSMTATGYTQSARLTVATTAQIKSTGVTFIDCPWSSWTVGDTRYWITSDWWGSNISKYSGPVDNPTKTIIYSKDRSVLYTNNASLNGNPWIVSIYKISDTELLAFIHVEYVKAGNIAKTGRIALGYSNNNGETFKYLGEIIAPKTDAEDFNIQGCPYLIKDGYFYIYFNEYNTNVARAKVADVVTAAKNGTVTAWNKYFNGGWNEPGMHGDRDAIQVAGICHTQAAYSTYDKKYYMLMTSMNWAGVNTYVKLYQSDDCLNWKFYQVVVDERSKTYQDASGWQYASIVDAGSGENSTVGQKFYVYCGRKPGEVKEMSMVRWTVDLADAPIKNTPVASWSFNGKPDDTIGDNDGFLEGSAMYAMGKSGAGVKMNGENSFVTIQNSNVFNQMSQITASIWFNMKGLPNNNYSVFAKDLSFRFIINDKGLAHFVACTDSSPWYTAGTIAQSSDKLQIDRWYHLVGTYDGNYVKIYINGVLKGTGAKTVNGKLSATHTALTIGNGSDYIDDFYGMIDEAKIYNKGLSAADVLKLYTTENVTSEESSSLASSTGTSSSKTSSAAAASSTNGSSQIQTSSDAVVSGSQSGISADESDSTSSDIAASSDISNSQDASTASSLSSTESTGTTDKGGSNPALIIVIVVLAAGALGTGGFFLYKKFAR